MKKIIFTCLFLVTAMMLHSADTNKVNLKIGVYGGLNLNMHNSDFSGLADCPNCFNSFRNAFGIGSAFGVLAEYPVYQNKMFAGVRFGYSVLDGKFLENEGTTVMQGDVAVPGNFEHVINSEFNVFGFEYYVSYNVWDALFVNIGGNSQFFNRAYFDQYEKITSPESATFIEDGENTYSKYRNEFEVGLMESEEENVTGLYQSIVIGASYMLPLNSSRTLTAEPEIMYNLALTDVLEDKNWSINPLRLGLAVKYNFKDKPEMKIEYEEREIIDTISRSNEQIAAKTIKTGQPAVSYDTLLTKSKMLVTVETLRVDTLMVPKEFELNADITASGITEQNEIIEQPLLSIEEFYSQKLQPLLNYVFFNGDETEIPERYVLLDKKAAENFKINSLYSESSLSVYHQLLNIIGSRLSENQDAELTIQGYSADGSNEISRRRANAVKSYFTGVWGIASSRLKTESGELPPKPSTPFDEPEKREENNRVELYSNNDEILKPVMLSDTIRRSSPPIVRFDYEAESEAGIENIKIVLEQKGKVLLTENQETGKTGSYEWAVTGNGKSRIKYDEPLTYYLEVSDKAENNFQSDRKQLEVQIKTITEKRRRMIDDKEYEKFSLILFDFDEAVIENENKKIIDMIKERVRENSEVEIVGYTDKTGDEDHNKRLSQKRAKAAYDALNIPGAKYKGIGEQELLYNNDLPEGRFYSRVVEITIITPVEY